ncbi:polyphenol oxidase family protein [Desulfothermus okinawensis JCM 13304]
MKCAFTTRVGGHSLGNFFSANLSYEVGDQIEHVKKNRQHILNQLNIKEVIEVKQIHGDKLICVDNTNFKEQPILKGDAIISSKKNVGLMVKTADCQPVLVCDKTGNFIGAFHVGWRANRGEFIKTWIDIFCGQYKLTPQNILAVRGPSLCPYHSEFVNFDNEFPDKFKKYFDTKSRRLDLWEITHDQLVKAGIPKSNIFRLDLCTYCLEELFFSYRRNRICGRQGSIIWRNN